MLILLDIDGVMVPANSWRMPEFMEDGFPVFSPRATVAFQKILDNVDAEIVLTTSHKFRYTLKEWSKIFRTRGINLKKIGRLPDNQTHLSRKDEILNWFQQNRTVSDFVIIDDDKSVNALPELIKTRLVLTSGSVGLTDELADEVISISGRNHLVLA